MESTSLEDENIIKNIRNLFILKKDIRKFRQEKEAKAIKDRILRDIKNLFEHEKEEENYYKLVRINNFWSLTIANSFISFLENNEECVMHSKSDNIEIMINEEVYEVIKELFDSLKNRYENNLKSMKGSEFVFHCVQLLHYKCHKINPNHSESYVDSPEKIKNKKATINLINKKINAFSTL